MIASTNNQDNVHTLRANGNAILNTLSARMCVERLSSSSSLCIAPLLNCRVEVDDKLIGVTPCAFGVASRTWCVFARLVRTFSA